MFVSSLNMLKGEIIAYKAISCSIRSGSRSGHRQTNIGEVATITRDPDTNLFRIHTTGKKKARCALIMSTEKATGRVMTQIVIQVIGQVYM